MIDNFPLAVHFTLSKAIEGGFVDDEDDPGKATNMGVTQETLSEWRGQPVTVDDVRNLTRDEALKIYRFRYWNPNKSDDLPAPVAVALFDGAVNSGTHQSAKWLQRAVGAADDGAIGGETIAAIGRMALADVVQRMIFNRREFDRSLLTYEKFKGGWESRLDALQEYCIGLNRG